MWVIRTPGDICIIQCNESANTTIDKRTDLQSKCLFLFHTVINSYFISFVPFCNVNFCTLSNMHSLLFQRAKTFFLFQCKMHYTSPYLKKFFINKNVSVPVVCISLIFLKHTVVPKIPLFQLVGNTYQTPSQWQWIQFFILGERDKWAGYIAPFLYVYLFLFKFPIKIPHTIWNEPELKIFFTFFFVSLYITLYHSKLTNSAKNYF